MAGEPYQITHRGNHRAAVFFEPEDREVYLAMLAAACQRFELDGWAYWMMTNHVHLLALPRSEVSMAAGMRANEKLHVRMPSEGARELEG